MRLIYLILLFSAFYADAQKVFFSFDTECPMSQKYVPVLQKIQADYPKIDFQAVFTKWDSDSTIALFKSQYGLKLPYRIDKDNALLQSWATEVVPEVFFFDEYDVLLYRGSIDNWFYALGKYRAKASEHYLREAIEAYSKGECIRREMTKALGCIIEY
jgi:thiol-disulfide isomerase/thioredoxin